MNIELLIKAKTPEDLLPDWSRISKSTGYPVVFCPNHPRAWSTGYVYVHVIIAEKKIQRFLSKTEVVHHKDENKTNFSEDNLEIKTRTQHAIEHAESQQKTTKMAELKCPECGKIFYKRPGLCMLSNNRGVLSFCSRSCAGRFYKLLTKQEPARSLIIENKIQQNFIKEYTTRL